MKSKYESLIFDVWILNPNFTVFIGLKDFGLLINRSVTNRLTTISHNN